MAGRLVVHIGLGKTGTTTLQDALDASQEALATYGVEVAGGGHRAMRRAVYDLVGRRIGGGENTGVDGSFKPFMASIATSTAPVVVLSEEMLAGARPGQIKRLVGAVGGREVIVVVTVRDLASVLGSYWQQQIMMGRSQTLPDFLESVRDPGSGSASAGVGFWVRQDLGRVLAAWETQVPRNNVRIVTVPADRSESLEDRFASVLDVPPGVLRAPEQTNASVGVPEAELIRRLNLAVAGQLKENHRLQVMRALRSGLVGRGSRSIGVPDLPWIHEQTQARISLLTSRGYQVVGSLDDLTPRTLPALPEASESEVADAAIAALVALTDDHGRLWRRSRRRQQPGPSQGLGITSRGRAATFALKARALDRADRNRLVAWAARTYLKRTSGR